MEFRLLGPLEVEEEGKVIPLGGAKQRALLALLLLDRGREVSTDRLVDEIWAGAPPQTAAKSIQVYVSGLRKLPGEGRIVTRERGYEALRVESGETRRRTGSTSSSRTAVRGRHLSEPAVAAPGRTLPRSGEDPFEDVSGSSRGRRAEVHRGLEERGFSRRTEAWYRRRPRAREASRAHPRARALRRRASLPGALPRAAHARALPQRAVRPMRSMRTGAARPRLRDELGLEPGRPLRDLEGCRPGARIPSSSSRRRPISNLPADALPRRRRAWMLVVAGAIAAVLAAGRVAILRWP